MDTTFYLERFEHAAGQIDKRLLARRGRGGDTDRIEIATGLYKENSVFLKLYKKSWASPAQDPLIAESRIFFSIWVSDVAIREEKLFYNIHALKLRRLKGYSIESRKFADVFRAGFKNFAPKWENVSVKYGPLTLMEGWVKIDLGNFQDEILELADKFLEIEYLIDDALAKFK
jgi:hypothetical protein